VKPDSKQLKRYLIRICTQNGRGFTESKSRFSVDMNP